MDTYSYGKSINGYFSVFASTITQSAKAAAGGRQASSWACDTKIIYKSQVNSAGGLCKTRASTVQVKGNNSHKARRGRHGGGAAVVRFSRPAKDHDRDLQNIGYFSLDNEKQSSIYMY